MTEMEKTVELPIEKLTELIDDFGMMKLSKAPVGFHIIAKILEPIEVKVIGEGTEDEFTVHTVLVEYEPKGYEPAQFKIQVGESAVTRMKAKFPDDKYVGMNAFFKRSKFGGKYPQHINPFVANTDGQFRGRPSFVKLKGNTGIAPQPKAKTQPEFVAELIANVLEDPLTFEDEYMVSETRDGITAPWHFIDDFNDNANAEGVEYSHDEILKVYNTIVIGIASNK